MISNLWIIGFGIGALIVVVVVGGSPVTVQGIPSFTEYMDVSV